MQKIIYVLLFSLTSIGVRSQTLQDTIFLASSAEQAKGVYSSAMAKQLSIYSGKDYKAYVAKGEEHPYFLSAEWIMGSIIYEESLYEKVPLMFDVSTDKILIENPFNATPMELASNKINQFNLDKHVFIRLGKDNSISNDMEEGFYELLYDGHLKLFAQRIKDFQNRIRGNISIPEFDEKNRYFLFDGTQYSKVTGKSSIVKALGGKKKLPKSNPSLQYYSSNKTENTLINWIKFFDMSMPPTP